uniref:Selenoprotein P N-terminal domain-containing protein n=1 Tax=Anopheles stephensi TaxID=30069 RepID=A0A182YK97_ANOST
MMNITNSFLDETLVYLYREMHQYVPEFIGTIGYIPWVFSLLGSALIGLSGILPMFIIPDATKNGKEAEQSNPAESKTLKVLLSFAVGGLLGDVFLHLLPETWEHEIAAGPTADGHPSLRSGLWVLSGLLLFTIVEKIFSGYANVDEQNPQPKCVEIATCLYRRSGAKLPEGFVGCGGGDGKGACDIEDVPNGCFLAGNSETARDETAGHKKVAGYLNLLANSIDNFTHGLAVAGSFLVSLQHGLLATVAILLHEIPHEVGDFAILLRSGFSRWDAAKAQLLTAGAGLLGALVAIGGSGATTALEAKTSWIAPFTAGGFLHIALVTVLPDLLDESNPWESFKQLAALLLGIGLMAAKMLCRSRVIVVAVVLVLWGHPGATQEMSISEELETCSTLDRPLLEREFGDGADDFFGKITVLYNVAPPKPVQTPRVFADRDPIFYNKIDYREQIKYYHNLYQMFHGQQEYRDEVRFLLSASLHRVPYELENYDFESFFSTVQTLAGEYNLTVYPNRLHANRTFALFGLREFQVYVIDRCSRVSYIIQPPWSLIQYAYVKAAVLSTYYDRPCGKCELENFLNSTLAENEKQISEGGGGSTLNDTKPYEDASEEETNHAEDEEDNDGVREAYSEEDDDDNDSGGDRAGSYNTNEDPFASLNVTGPELELPLRIILPVLHVHVPAENDTQATNEHKLHPYIVLHSNNTEGHAVHPFLVPTQPEVTLQELPLPVASNSTPVVSSTVGEDAGTLQQDKIRVGGSDWSVGELGMILNTSSVLYDPKQQRLFERLQRYNLTAGAQFDEVAEISVSNRFDAWNRRRAPPKADPSRNNKRSQIKKHYARLIPWLNWTFGRAIPPASRMRVKVSGSVN